VIPVKKQKEPADFAAKVTRKALAFLARVPNPTKGDIDARPWWRNALDDLYKTYGEVCTYSGLWFQRDAVSVDHFTPIGALWKDNPTAAYEWDNFRLASRSMNFEKGDYTDVVDPFTIKPFWFVIDFSSMNVKSGSDLSSEEKARVDATIKRLKLNDIKKRYITFRRKLINEYCDKARKWKHTGQALEVLNEKAPFIAFELKRQGLEKKIVKDLKSTGKTIKGSVA